MHLRDDGEEVGRGLGRQAPGWLARKEQKRGRVFSRCRVVPVNRRSLGNLPRHPGGRMLQTGGGQGRGADASQVSVPLPLERDPPRLKSLVPDAGTAQGRCGRNRQGEHGGDGQQGCPPHPAQLLTLSRVQSRHCRPPVWRQVVLHGGESTAEIVRPPWLRWCTWTGYFNNFLAPKALASIISDEAVRATGPHKQDRPRCVARVFHPGHKEDLTLSRVRCPQRS